MLSRVIHVHDDLSRRGDLVVLMRRWSREHLGQLIVGKISGRIVLGSDRAPARPGGGQFALLQMRLVVWVVVVAVGGRLVGIGRCRSASSLQISRGKYNIKERKNKLRKITSLSACCLLLS